ncbi:hypothetical protein F5883DRAFT_714206 [Diaporthe sp. PMI_573]|nr:hypothetical protein F5883DRAFT_714206 [Diaporthaceae sp. PMI_573]
MKFLKTIGRRQRKAGSSADPRPQTPKPSRGLSTIWPVPQEDGQDNKSHESSNLDIVLVHGLNGDSYTTWTEDTVFWPHDLLPNVLPKARIMTFGYNANLFVETGCGDIHDFAETLISEVLMERSGCESRPLVFIGHSMGGLVIKRALVIAKTKPRFEVVLESTRLLVFMGTPHAGSALANWGAFVSSVWAAARGSCPTPSTKQLSEGSETLSTICSDFIDIATRLKIITFYETKPTPGWGLIVEKHSAKISHPSEVVVVDLDADHRGLPRFQGAEDPRFKRFMGHIKHWMEYSVGPVSASVSASVPASVPASAPSSVTPSVPASVPASVPVSVSASVPSSVPSSVPASVPTSVPGHLQSLSNLPNFPERSFFPRNDEIKAIKATFNRDVELGLCVHYLYGAGGVGKSSIALEYGWTQRHDKYHVFWMHARQEPKLMQDIDSISQTLLFPDDDNNEQLSSAELFQRWLSQNSRWLLIFDEVENLNFVKKRYWPKDSTHGRILLTTKNPNLFVGKYAYPVEKTCVRSFDDRTGAEFVKQQLQDIPFDLVAAKRASILLGGLPIGMRLLASYLETSACTLQDFLELPPIKNLSFQLLHNHQDQEENDSDEDQGHKNTYEKLSFSTVNDLALKAVEKDPAATELLNFLSLLSLGDIDEPLIQEGAKSRSMPELTCVTNPVLYNKAIATLRKWSLIEKDIDKKQLRLHSLVRSDVIEKWTGQQWMKNFMKAVHVLEALFPKQVKGGSLIVGDTRNRCAQVAAHVEALEARYRWGLDKWGQEHVHGLVGFAELLAHCGYYMYERGLQSTAIQVLNSAREICANELGQDNPHLVHALVLNNLSNLVSESSEQLKLDKKVVEWRRQLLGPRDIELGNSLVNLAIDYYDSEDLQMAKSTFKDARDIFEANDQNQETKGLLYSNMGRTLLRLGELEEAESALTRAEKIQKAQIGEDHYFTTATMYWISNLRVKQGRLSDAQDIIEKVVDLRQPPVGDWRLGVAYHKLAWILHSRKLYDKAIDTLRKAISAFEEGAENCDKNCLIRSKLYLARMLDEYGVSPNDKEEASSLQKEALQERSSVSNISKSAPWRGDEFIDALVFADYR